MNDLGEAEFYRAVAAVELERDVYHRYHTLLDLQQDATGRGDFPAVLALADEIDAVLADLGRLTPVCDSLLVPHREELAGPRVEALERQLDALTAEIEAVEGKVRALTLQLLATAGTGA